MRYSLLVATLLMVNTPTLAWGQARGSGPRILRSTVRSTEHRGYLAGLGWSGIVGGPQLMAISYLPFRLNEARYARRLACPTQG